MHKKLDGALEAAREAQEQARSQARLAEAAEKENLRLGAELARLAARPEEEDYMQVGFSHFRRFKPPHVLTFTLSKSLQFFTFAELIDCGSVLGGKAMV